MTTNTSTNVPAITNLASIRVIMGKSLCLALILSMQLTICGCSQTYSESPTFPSPELSPLSTTDSPTVETIPLESIPCSTIESTGPFETTLPTEAGPTLAEPAVTVNTDIASTGTTAITEPVVQATESSQQSIPLASDISAEMNARPGMTGRLFIPSVGIDVALFYSSLYDSSQHIVDASDSAAYLDTGVQFIIADHKHQGFAAMKNSIPNQTIATIDFGGHTQDYLCTRKFIGVNDGKYLLDETGRCIYYQNIGGLAMYTCNENWTSITVTFWQPMDEFSPICGDFEE